MPNPFEIELAKVKADAKAETERLAKRDRQQADLIISLANAFAELRWLERDYDEERDGDPYR